MAVKEKKAHNVSDPGHFDPLIAAQKKRARRYPDDAREWLELGRLQRAKKELTNCLAKRNIGIRYFFPFYLASVGFLTLFAKRNISSLHLPTWRYTAFLSTISFILIIIS